MSVTTQLPDDWDRHWTAFGEASEMGPSTKFRKRLVVELLAEAGLTEQSAVLDIGSGRGVLTESIIEAFPGVQAMGIELSATGVAEASRRLPQARFYQRNLLENVDPSNLPSEKATHAVCSEVLEHIDDPAALLRNAAQYMGPGCRLVVTVPGGPMCGFDRHIGHRRHYSPDSLRRLLESAGFDGVSAYGTGFPFFNLYRLVVTLRGDRLVADVTGPPSMLMRSAMAVFDFLFRFNLRSRGWQIVAVASKK
jgi:SAM-dependent methyltransferase